MHRKVAVKIGILCVACKGYLISGYRLGCDHSGYIGKDCRVALLFAANLYLKVIKALCLPAVCLGEGHELISNLTVDDQICLNAVGDAINRHILRPHLLYGKRGGHAVKNAVKRYAGIAVNLHVIHRKTMLILPSGNMEGIAHYLRQVIDQDIVGIRSVEHQCPAVFDIQADFQVLPLICQIADGIGFFAVEHPNGIADNRNQIVRSCSGFVVRSCLPVTQGITAH